MTITTQCSQRGCTSTATRIGQLGGLDNWCAEHDPVKTPVDLEADAAALRADAGVAPEAPLAEYPGVYVVTADYVRAKRRVEVWRGPASTSGEAVARGREYCRRAIDDGDLDNFAAIPAPDRVEQISEAVRGELLGLVDRLKSVLSKLEANKDETRLRLVLMIDAATRSLYPHAEGGIDRQRLQLAIRDARHYVDAIPGEPQEVVVAHLEELKAAPRLEVSRQFAMYLHTHARHTLVPADGWSVEQASNYIKLLGKPSYGFRFVVRARRAIDLDSREVSRSQRYFVGAEVKTVDDIEEGSDPIGNETLRANMRDNGWVHVVCCTMADGSTWYEPLAEGDVLLGWEPAP